MTKVGIKIFVNWYSFYVILFVILNVIPIYILKRNVVRKTTMTTADQK